MLQRENARTASNHKILYVAVFLLPKPTDYYKKLCVETHSRSTPTLTWQFWMFSSKTQMISVNRSQCHVRLWNLFNTKGQLLTNNLYFKSFSMSICLYKISLQDWFRISCSLLTFLISTAALGQGNTSAPRIDCFFPWSAICLGFKAHFISSIWTLC